MLLEFAAPLRNGDCSATIWMEAVILIVAAQVMPRSINTARSWFTQRPR